MAKNKPTFQRVEVNTNPKFVLVVNIGGVNTEIELSDDDTCELESALEDYRRAQDYC